MADIIYKHLPNGDFVVGHRPTGVTARLYHRNNVLYNPRDMKDFYLHDASYAHPMRTAKFLLQCTDYFVNDAVVRAFDEKNWKDIQS